MDLGMRLWLPIILIISLATTTGTAITSKKQIDMFFGMAQGNYLIGDCNGALRGIDEILHIDPDFLPALKLQARVLLDEGQAEAALQATNRAIQLAPADSENQLLKALIYGNLNRRDEAVAIVLSIIETEVPSSHHHRARGRGGRPSVLHCDLVPRAARAGGRGAGVPGALPGCDRG